MSRILKAAIAASLMLPFLVTAAPGQDQTLYQRLGGYDAIAAVTDAFFVTSIPRSSISRLAM